MQYKVRIKKKAARGLKKLPANVHKLLFLLVEDLKADGPIQKSWNNFSPLGDDKYHCHYNYP
jgi:mRNA-degrading endonuclease RelE of RelBE toxin-antitoxin system